MDLMPIARSLALFALVLLVIAGGLFLASKFNLNLGKLPGDIIIRSGNFSCALPLVSSLLLSILITIILNLLLAFLRK